MYKGAANSIKTLLFGGKEKLMGLTYSSVGVNTLKNGGGIHSSDMVCALVGNPNVGKSSLFNALTGLSQHTGNWTGKTVMTAVGYCEKADITFVDLPGTYSLRADSPEEQVTGEFIESGEASSVCVVCDALCLERGLSLALQILELTPSVCICVNMIDEAKRRGVIIDTEKLASMLGVPVVSASAKRRFGLSELCKAIAESAKIKERKFKLHSPEVESEFNRLEALGYTRFEAVKAWLSGGELASDLTAAFEKLSDGKPDEFRNQLTCRPTIMAEALAADVTGGSGLTGYSKRDRLIDGIVTHRIFSVPVMLILLAGIFWLTVTGANYPSAQLQKAFDYIEAWLYSNTGFMPEMLRGMLILGGVRTLFRVVAVMLPPMAIFFPLFTLLEDFGLLGRIAFNLDGAFCRASACGKQALTMCMGLGCNAAGVVGCRIITSKRERAIAILTNSFMPCNGRFPILIAISAMLFSGSVGRLGAALTMTTVIIVATLATLAASKLLSVTILRGKSSNFTLELPSYRMPNVWQVIVRSVFDRTLFVLGRAAAVALPAGIVIWVLANINTGGESLLMHLKYALDPLGRFIGLDGAVLCAFILAFPANEIVLPIILMCYTASTSLGGDTGIAALLAENGWTVISYINMLILTVFHFPCSTTVLTVKKETGSIGYALLSMIMPTAIGLCLCAVTNAVFGLI